MRASFTIAIATTTLLIGSAFAQGQAPSSPQGQSAQAPAAERAPAATPNTATRTSPPAPNANRAAEAPAASGPGNPAVKTTEGNNPNATAPVAGANSFTEGEAKSRIESRGFTNVTALKKDDQGIWRAKAQRQGKTVDVALDFQGNVYAN